MKVPYDHCGVSRRVTISLLITGLSVLAQPVSPGAEMQARVVRDIDAAQRYRDSNLVGYRAMEHYTISNSHFSISAEVVVQTTYMRALGKTYEVLSRNGPSILKNRVMDRILDEEAKMSRGFARLQSMITSDNYDMHLIGEEKIGDRPCLALELMPKRKSPHLLAGKLWVDSRSKAVVRIDGQTPVGVSFFEGRPEIVRDYAFERLLEEIITPDVFAAAKILRERNSFIRDDGTPLNYRRSKPRLRA